MHLNFTIRLLDIIISVFILIILFPVLFAIYIFLFIVCQKPIFKQERIGINKEIFIIYKFRTMKIDTKDIATHLAPDDCFLWLGKFLRRYKLDELPQFFNVLNGTMSIVGPRPCLISQKELIELRDKFKLYKIKPGITGLAKIKKIDMSTPHNLVDNEKIMINNFNIYRYINIIFLTIRYIILKYK
jgi:lipopolysaccharide/colanic/teichoic acid biosynthesis glycosyltransferase